MAESIKHLYSSKGVSNLFVKVVLERLSKGCFTSILSQDQIRNSLLRLVERCQGWLTLVDNQEGDILRMNKSMKPAEISAIINKIAQ